MNIIWILKYLKVKRTDVIRQLDQKILVIKDLEAKMHNHEMKFEDYLKERDYEKDSINELEKKIETVQISQVKLDYGFEGEINKNKIEEINQEYIRNIEKLEKDKSDLANDSNLKNTMIADLETKIINNQRNSEEKIEKGTHNYDREKS